MSFKLTSVAYCDDVTNDVIGDFQVKMEQWNRSNLRTFRNSRRRIESVCPNQKEQPIVTKEEISSTYTNDGFVTSSYVSDQVSDSDQTENVDSVPHFTIVEERPVQYHELTCEYQCNDSQMERTLQEDDSLIIFNKWCQSAIPNNGKMSCQQQNMPVLNVKTNQEPYDSQHNKWNTFFYRNQLCNNGQWSLIWDLNKFENIPLILDRNDKYISFIDRMDTGKITTPKQLDSLDLLPQKKPLPSTDDQKSEKICSKFKCSIIIGIGSAIY